MKEKKKKRSVGQAKARKRLWRAHTPGHRLLRCRVYCVLFDDYYFTLYRSISITALNLFESRGIERVPLHERHGAADYLQISLLWFSTNITAKNMALGMLGLLNFSLGFVDLLSVGRLVRCLEPPVLHIWEQLDPLMAIVR